MSHPDFKEIVTAGTAGGLKKLIILHHWDTDGLASAAMFLDYMEKAAPDVEVVLMNPTINNYFLLESEYEWIQNQQADVLLTTDINFPVDVIDRLDEIVPQVFVFDHHSQTAHINRPGVQDTSYPGCTLLVSEYLGRELDLTAVSGAVGDQEDKITEWSDWWPKIEAVLDNAQLDFDAALKLTKMVDTTYMVGSTEQLHYAIQLIRTDITAALSDERFLANEELIQAEFSRELDKEMEHIGEYILFQPIESTLSLISEVTRARAKSNPDAVIVTQQQWGEMSSFYVRRRNKNIDLGQVVDMARAKGYNAGGKPEVAGVVLPTDAVDAFREETIALLQSVLA